MEVNWGNVESYSEVDKYKNATNWVEMANYIRAIEDYPDITGG